MTRPLVRLLEAASQQHGFVTAAQAAEVEVTSVALRRLVRAGLLEHRSHGVYRVSAVALDELAEYQEAVLWAQGRAAIGGESALSLFDLADVNPRHIYLVLPPGYRPRGKGGERYELHHERLAPDDLDEISNVPVVVPAVAIRQAVTNGLAGDLVEQAIRRAAARELIGTRASARLLVQLDDRARGKARR